MKMEDIAAFAAVVRYRSISLAARTLSLTQPAISRRIQSFEESLGLELLDRNTKPPLPNKVGKLIYEQCCAVLREVDALRELAAGGKLTQGTLRLGVVQLVGDIALVDALRHVRDAYPNLVTQVSTSWASDLTVKLRNGHLDAAAVLFPAAHHFSHGITARSLGKIPLVVVASRNDYPKRSYSLADCNSRGWILNPDGCGFRATLERMLAAENLRIRVNLETSGSELQLGLVADGLGLGLMPLPLLERSAHKDQLRVIAVAGFRPVLDLWLIHAQQLGELRKPVDSFGDRVALKFNPTSAKLRKSA